MFIGGYKQKKKEDKKYKNHILCHGHFILNDNLENKKIAIQFENTEDFKDVFSFTLIKKNKN